MCLVYWQDLVQVSWLPWGNHENAPFPEFPRATVWGKQDFFFLMKKIETKMCCFLTHHSSVVWDAFLWVPSHHQTTAKMWSSSLASFPASKRKCFDINEHPDIYMLKSLERFADFLMSIQSINTENTLFSWKFCLWSNRVCSCMCTCCVWERECQKQRLCLYV